MSSMINEAAQRGIGVVRGVVRGVAMGEARRLRLVGLATSLPGFTGLNDGYGICYKPYHIT